MVKTKAPRPTKVEGAFTLLYDLTRILGKKGRSHQRC